MSHSHDPKSTNNKERAPCAYNDNFVLPSFLTFLLACDQVPKGPWLRLILHIAYFVSFDFNRAHI